MDWIVRAIDTAKSLRVWVLISTALIGYAALYLPAFGGADLTPIHSNSWVAWLAAVSGSILTIIKFFDLIISTNQIKTRKRKERLWKISTNKFILIYSPIASEFAKIHIFTCSSAGAPYLRQRLHNAFANFGRFRQNFFDFRSVWSAVFDHQISPTTGEIEFGGVFPLGFIKDVVYKNTQNCDEKLIYLTRFADETRITSQRDESYLSTDDCILIMHIFEEHRRLKKFLGR